MGDLNVEMTVRAVGTLTEARAEHWRRDQTRVRQGPHATTAAPSHTTVGCKPPLVSCPVLKLTWWSSWFY